MKITKKLTAISVIILIIFSIAGMNVFAASTTQDGLEVSLTTDKETYSKDEKVTATLSVKNTNITDITNVTMEIVTLDGYEVADESKNTKQLDKLTPNKTAELNIVYVAKSTGEVSQSNKSSNSNNPIAKTGDDIFLVVPALILLSVSVVLIFISVKKKKGKVFLSVAVCTSILGAIILVVSFNMPQAADSSKTISITEKIITDGEEININAFVKYDLKGNNHESSENSKNGNNSAEKNVIKNSLSETLDCIINNNFNSNFHYMSMYGKVKEELIENDIPRAVAKNISYKIENIEISQDDNGNTFAIVDTNFKSVDMIALLSELKETENYRQIIINKLDNKEFTEKSFDIQVIMIKIDDIWYLYETIPLNDVFMGGLYSLDIAAQEEFFNQLNEESE